MDLLVSLIAVFLLFWVLGIAFFASVGVLVHAFFALAVFLIIVKLLKGHPEN